MPLKDYYSILGVAPGAQNEEIKRAYRRLALIHHPDKNKDNPYAAAYFHEIREAYDTLMDPIRKDHYLQQRWYAKAMGKKFTDKAITPESVLNDAVQLNKYVHSLNSFRVDKPALAAQIHRLLNEDTIDSLEKYKSDDTNRQICHLLLECLDALDHTHIGPIAIKLKKLSSSDPAFSSLIDNKIKKKTQTDQFNRYRVWLILLLTLALCLVIWLS